MNESSALRFVTNREAIVEELPWGPHEWLSRPGLVAADQLLLVRVTMPPGKGHSFHRHPLMEEIIYVVEGEAQQWVETEKRTLTVGQIAHIPVNLVHATFNNSEKPLVFLAILSPANAPGPPLVDVSLEEPWASLRQQ
ncbi:cupin domain-containing protein [bacterium]|jgi:quercetin dioxygenase-like cupin family protein|nr:cupin domain-containing protein [bacterium]